MSLGEKVKAGVWGFWHLEASSLCLIVAYEAPNSIEQSC